jgi:hypothetical protein
MIAVDVVVVVVLVIVTECDISPNHLKHKSPLVHHQLPHERREKKSLEGGGAVRGHKRKQILHLEGSQALPASPSDRVGVDLRVLFNFGLSILLLLMLLELGGGCFVCKYNPIFGQNFDYYSWEGCMGSIQCNVEFGYQLSICSRTKENYGKPLSSWPVNCPMKTPNMCTNIQLLPHRKHITSPLQSPTG